MTRFVGLDVLQKLTAICVVDETGRRLWRGQCATDPGQIERAARGHAGEDARIGVETGPMSGEVDRSGRISRYGDTLARTLLYKAAVVLLTRVKRASSLKDWARAIAKRSGPGKARVALARKLSVILHSIWRSGEALRWSEQEQVQAA